MHAVAERHVTHGALQQHAFHLSIGAVSLRIFLRL